MTHVGLRGADEQRLLPGLTEHAGDAVDFLWVPDLRARSTGRTLPCVCAEAARFHQGKSLQTFVPVP